MFAVFVSITSSVCLNDRKSLLLLTINLYRGLFYELMCYFMRRISYYILAIIGVLCVAMHSYAQQLSIKKQGAKCVLQLSDSLLDRDLLYAGRVVDLSRQYNTSAGLTLHNPIVVRFSKSPNKGYLEMQQIVSNAIYPENEPAKHIINRNNVIPVLRGFKYKVGEDKKLNIDVTAYFSGEIAEVDPLPRGIKQGRLDKTLSGIQKVQTLDNRINVVTRYVYTGARKPFVGTLCYTLMVLPEKPMRPRIADERVNYFDTAKKLFDTSKAVKSIDYAHRWRLEPKPEDRASWKSGQLVEPAKPIVFYFDPSTPPLIKKYAKEGILAWNAAFERIGFKNVMRVKDFPKGTFLSEDMGVNVFRYVPTDRANASGPCWVDPRSGEIIQADIIWWHNVMQLLQTWRFVQTAAVDPAARPAELSEKVWGDMIRYAVAHETGHTLGLKHNFRGSYSYSADSLRSPKFTKEFGTSATIMDYARFNFVAQPGDLERGVQLTPPLLGVQDKFAIEWGYMDTSDMSQDEEKKTLNQLFLAHGNDPMYLHAPSESTVITRDPSAQSEQLGNDLLVSTDYGIRNMKVIMAHLPEWTIDKNKSYDRLKRMYEGVVKQFYSFLRADAAYMGGVYTYNGVAGEFDANYVPVSLKEQKQAMQFLVRQLRLAPVWLGNETVSPYIGNNKSMLERQQSLVKALFDSNFLSRMAASTYTVDVYLSDMVDALTEKTPYNKNTKEGRAIFENDRRLQYMMLQTITATASKIEDGNSKDVYSADILEAVKSAKHRLQKYSKHEVIRASSK